MSGPSKHQACTKAELLVEAIDRRDSQTLSRDFGISNAVSEEIYESLDSYFDKGTQISLAPVETACNSTGQGRPFIDVYETNDKALGLECVLFANGAPSEAILHIEVSMSEQKLAVYYKYIGC